MTEDVFVDCSRSNLVYAIYLLELWITLVYDNVLVG